MHFFYVIKRGSSFLTEEPPQTEIPSLGVTQIMCGISSHAVLLVNIRSFYKVFLFHILV